MFILRILLLVIATLGFSFYLWFLSISDEQSQNRILNILHGYLAVACLGLCPELIIVPYVNEQLYEFSIRIASFIIIAITLIFLLISVATILMHFRPGVYLELSWNHKIAAPTLLVFFINLVFFRSDVRSGSIFVVLDPDLVFSVESESVFIVLFRIYFFSGGSGSRFS